MQIVIDMSEHEYEVALRDGWVHGFYSEKIKNGTPLPKGHGRLIGADRLKAEVFNACMDEHFMPMKYLDCDTITEILDNSPTIIPADKEE